MLEDEKNIEYEETKKDETTDNVRTLIDAKPEHYGKIVVVKGFNDPEVVAYGDKMEEVIEKAEKAGYKVVSHKDDLSSRGMLLRVSEKTPLLAVGMNQTLRQQIKDSL